MKWWFLNQLDVECDPVRNEAKFYWHPIGKKYLRFALSSGLRRQSTHANVLRYNPIKQALTAIDGYVIIK